MSSSQNVFTLINPQDGNLAIKIFSFNDNGHFDHLQRNNYYSLLWIKEGNGIRFRIGKVEMMGISLRARCNVPLRNPFTGETDKTFIKRMLVSRQDTVQTWSQVKKMGSLYYLTVNTFIPDSETGKEIKTGDKIVLY